MVGHCDGSSRLEERERRRTDEEDVDALRLELLPQRYPCRLGAVLRAKGGRKMRKQGQLSSRRPAPKERRPFTTHSEGGEDAHLHRRWPPDQDCP